MNRAGRTSIIGTSVVRKDAREKLNGRARFAADYHFPGMLRVKVVRSPHPRARILDIDVTDAMKVPGVVVVLTASDIPGRNSIPVVLDDLRLLAEGEVRFHGEPVALIGAETEEAAEDGARLVRVQYEEMTPVLDPLEALEEGSPCIYGNDNLYKRWDVHRGDVDGAMAKAHLVVENTYHTPYQEHAYLEPQGMVVVPTPSGGMEVTGSMQCPFYVREGVAVVLGLPLASVRVVQAATGGGFGGKEDVPSIVAGQAALVAARTGRPASLIYSRDEDILSMSKRHPAVIVSKYGFDEEGTLLAAQVRYVLDSGAYSTLSPVVAWRGTVHAVGPYRCDNVIVETFAVATNKVPCGAYRGFGSPQVLFAAESQMDEAAYRLGLDPLELRRRNALRDGDRTPTGQQLKAEVGLQEAMEKAAASSQWPDRFEAPGSGTGSRRYGIGCSTVHYGVCLGAGGRSLDRAGAFVQLMYDGSAIFAVGTTEMGQGMLTVLSQVVAEELGIPYASVRPVAPDTHMVPDSGPTVASRTTVMSGNALVSAAAPIRSSLLVVAGDLLDVEPAAVTLENGVASAPDGRSLGYDRVLARCFDERRHLASSGWVESPPTSWDEKTGEGEAYITYAFAANVVEVEVDLHTGEVEVLRIHAAHDVGRAINPMSVEGQIQGGSVQGLGYALMEEVLYEGGRMLNNQFSTYLIPTARDVPPIHAHIVEHPAGVGPYGAKGFAEQPLMGIAPAVANAVFNATGVRVRELPITPERLWEALKREGVE